MDPCESFRVWLVEDTSAVDMSEKDLMRIFLRVPHTPQVYFRKSFLISSAGPMEDLAA